MLTGGLKELLSAVRTAGISRRRRRRTGRGDVGLSVFQDSCQPWNLWNADFQSGPD